jgi:hypothetical protein
VRRAFWITVIVVALLAVTATAAYAITGNWVDDDQHPFVAMVAFYAPDPDTGKEVFVWRCSGSLIDSTKLLTAGHCTEGATSARAWFQQDAGANYDPELGYDPVTGYADKCADGTLGSSCATSHELYNYGFHDFVGFPNIHDVGIVILDQPIGLSEYGKLPPPGTLDGVGTARGKKDTVFTVSGYGLTYRTNDKDALPNLSFRIRLMAKSTLVNLGSANTDGYNLQTQGNGDDRGGTCSGDSGGPVFLGGFDSDQIVAVTSFGMNALCRGTDFAYRIDRQEVLDWIKNPG